MQRRQFLKTSLAFSGAAGLSAFASAAESATPAAREYYQLMLYHLRRGPKQKLFDDFLRAAFVPAMNRIGLGPVGVFNVMTGPDSPTFYVLVRYPTIQDFVTGQARLRADAEFLKAGAEVTNAPATDPTYVRLESSFMVAFEGMPKLEVPAGAAGNQPRIFELRTYESHSKKANAKKIEMFNVGEIAIFRRAGLTPVFFGETLVGTKLPNLTYMLVYESMAAKDKAWAAFGGDPEWKKLSTTPGYTDAEIVSNISNVLLRPAPYSQI